MKDEDSLKNFTPKGAMAFFLSMILFIAVVWLGAYFLMIYRA